MLLQSVRRAAPQLAERRPKVGPAHAERARQLPQRHVAMPVAIAAEGADLHQRRPHVRHVEVQLVRERLREVAERHGPLVLQLLERGSHILDVGAECVGKARGEAILVPLVEALEGALHLVGRDAERVGELARELVAAVRVRLVMEVAAVPSSACVPSP